MKKLSLVLVVISYLMGCAVNNTTDPKNNFDDDGVIDDNIINTTTYNNEDTTSVDLNNPITTTTNISIIIEDLQIPRYNSENIALDVDTCEIVTISDLNNDVYGLADIAFYDIAGDNSYAAFWIMNNAKIIQLGYLDSINNIKNVPDIITTIVSANDIPFIDNQAYSIITAQNNLAVIHVHDFNVNYVTVTCVKYNTAPSNSKGLEVNVASIEYTPIYIVDCSIPFYSCIDFDNNQIFNTLEEDISDVCDARIFMGPSTVIINLRNSAQIAPLGVITDYSKIRSMTTDNFFYNSNISSMHVAQYIVYGIKTANGNYVKIWFKEIGSSSATVRYEVTNGLF